MLKSAACFEADAFVRPSLLTQSVHFKLVLLTIMFSKKSPQAANGARPTTISARAELSSQVKCFWDLLGSNRVTLYVSRSVGSSVPPLILGSIASKVSAHRALSYEDPGGFGLDDGHAGNMSDS